MPLWKKVKNTRISQLVNDHIRKRRRDGSSVVVEPVFPTSLVDLFVKHREKLIKPSKKKRRSPSITSIADDSKPVIGGSRSIISYPSNPNPPPPPPSPSLVGSPAPIRNSSVLPPPPSYTDEICVAGPSRSGAAVDVAVEEEKRGDERGGRDVNTALIRVTKIFAVAVLAVATKRLTVGITVSAVLLLLLEHVCGGLRAAAKSAARIGWRLLRLINKQEQQEEEPSTNLEREENTKESLSRERFGYQEIELLEMAMKKEESMREAVDSIKKSRRSKIKSKMRRIVPKKLRRSRKKEQDDVVEEYDNGSISSSLSDRSSICSDSRSCDVIDEADSKIQEKGPTGTARRYMLLLCLIVLAGLIVGRRFALVLTVSCFLLVKLGQKLPRRIKLPMIMSG